VVLRRGDLSGVLDHQILHLTLPGAAQLPGQHAFRVPDTAGITGGATWFDGALAGVVGRVVVVVGLTSVVTVRMAGWSG